jgi:hypothetical protein
MFQVASFIGKIQLRRGPIAGRGGAREGPNRLLARYRVYQKRNYPMTMLLIIVLVILLLGGGGGYYGYRSYGGPGLGGALGLVLIVLLVLWLVGGIGPYHY